MIHMKEHDSLAQSFKSISQTECFLVFYVNYVNECGQKVETPHSDAAHYFQFLYNCLFLNFDYYKTSKNSTVEKFINHFLKIPLGHKYSKLMLFFI